MAKTKQSRGKLVRKFGENIFGNPKYDRLLNRKPYGPGQHAQTRRAKVSNYGIQLQEKQKIVLNLDHLVFLSDPLIVYPLVLNHDVRYQ